MRVCAALIINVALAQTSEVHVMSSHPSVFASLFYFSFSRFVTIRFVKFIYVTSRVLLVFGVIGWILVIIGLVNSEGPTFEWLAAIVFGLLGAAQKRASKIPLREVGLLLAPTGPLSDVERGLILECAHVRSSLPPQ